MSVITKDRTTIYIGNAYKAALLQWAQDFVNAKNTSEAIFMAIERLKELVGDERKNERLQALRANRGIWADDENIERAFGDLNESWPTPKLEDES